MIGTRCCVALLLVAALHAELPAQVLVTSSAPVLVPGIGFRYQGHHLGVSGFIATGPPLVYAPYMPYGFVQRNISIQVVTPTVVIAPRRTVALEDYDLTGVDLDRVPASAIWGEPEPRREIARNPAGPERLGMPRDAARPAPARKVEAVPAPKKPEPAPAKKPEPPPPKKAEPPPKRPVDDLWQPRAEPAAEARRLVELGIRAFREEQYGIASLRFRQATEVDPTLSRAFFLLGFAEHALGDFREAVAALGTGLRLQPDWPAADFRPKVELYDGKEDAWALHRERLFQTHKLRPKEGAYLFLLGMIDWFGDRRREAIDWFRQARPLLPDRPSIDLFLKSPAAPAPPA
jgi:tetratricopeptide (TPR) repeat protein